MANAEWVKLCRLARGGAIVTMALAVAQCGKAPNPFDSKYGVSASPRVIQPGQPVPKGGGTYRVGKPYVVAGRTYVPEENPNYSESGIASWYGEDFHGRLTANGEIYDMAAISAAHPTLPIPSYARVTNLNNSRSIIVRVNDRGPFHQDRVIDLSVRTAQLLGFHGNGIARVRVDYVGRAGLDGSDDSVLEATLRQGQPAPAPLTTASIKAQAPKERTAATAAPQLAPKPTQVASKRNKEPVATEASAAKRVTNAPVLAASKSTPARTPPRRVAEPKSTFEARFAAASNLSQANATSTPATAYAPAPEPQASAAPVGVKGFN